MRNNERETMNVDFEHGLTENVDAEAEHEFYQNLDEVDTISDEDLEAASAFYENVMLRVD